MKLPAFNSPDGRRAWAFIAIWGGAVTFTLFAAVGVWLVSAVPELSFWLALAAHGQVLVGMTALGWAMGRRVNIEAGHDGFEISDAATGKPDDPIHIELEGQP